MTPLRVALVTGSSRGLTLGVPRQDSGVASAMVNTSQQVGGSIDTTLLSTLAVSATTDYIVWAAAVPPSLRIASTASSPVAAARR